MTTTTGSPGPDREPGPATTERTLVRERLGALAEQLKAHRLDVELTTCGLRVAKPPAPGYSNANANAADTITCRPRPEDGQALWFFTSWQEAIAPADHLTDAIVVIKGHLAGDPA